jgi:predicted lipoprotein with Yx(FWY)xxD motif
MHIKHHRLLAAAVLTAAVPGGILATQAGASTMPHAVAAKASTVALRSTHLGHILVAGSTGRTLYLYDKDGKNKSNCTGSCAAVWPPLMASGKPSAGAGVSGSKLGEIKRGGGHQVTYAGHPLYTFQSDSAAGQTSGEGVGGFYVVAASGSAVK